MRVGLRAALACMAAALVLVLGACGGDDDPGPGPATGSRTLTIYSSLPLHGPNRRQSEDMVNAIKLALEEAGGKVGPLTVNYVSLDSADEDSGDWTSDLVLDNARTAVRDPNTIAYIGDFDSAATALSLPLLNEGGILQVSPSSTYVGLTRPGTGRKGEPERFYPAGRRTFGRVVPADHIQAAALVGYMREERVRRLYILHDRDLYGSGLAEQLDDLARAEGIEVVADDGLDARTRDLGDRAREVARSGADAFFFGGSAEAGAARMYGAVGAADPRLLLFAPDAVAQEAFAQSIGPAVQRRMRITSPALQPRLLPAAARRFRTTFRATFGREPEPYAIYAYEAMGAALQAVRDAGDEGNVRRAVVDAFFAIRNRRSPLGTYSIDRNGDVSLSTYAGRRVERSRLVYDKVLKVQT
jgi:branched-chain amino acid transport system substrate-binding protein